MRVDHASRLGAGGPIAHRSVGLTCTTTAEGGAPLLRRCAGRNDTVVVGKTMTAARSRTAADNRCRWPRAPPAAHMWRPCTAPRAPQTAAAAPPPPPAPRVGSSRAWSPSACLSRRRSSRSATATAEARLRPWSEVASPSSGGVAGAAAAVPSRCVRRVVSGVVADRAGARADPRVRGRGRDRRRRRGPVVRGGSRSLRARGRAVPRVDLRGRRAAARAVARGDRPGGRGPAVGAARAAPVRGVPARLRDRAIRFVARRIRGAGPAGAARPRGRDA